MSDQDYLTDSERADILLRLLSEMRQLYTVLDRDGKSGKSVVFAQISTTFNNICEIVEVNKTNSNIN